MNLLGYFNRTQNILFAVLATTSIVLIILFAALLSLYWNDVFTRYKENYFSERTYHILYALRSQWTDPSATERSDRVNEISAQYAVPLRFYLPDQETAWFDSYSEQSPFQSPVVIEVPFVYEGKVQGYLHAYYDLNDISRYPYLNRLSQEVIQKKAKSRLHLL